jgi:hypothetical protein
MKPQYVSVSVLYRKDKSQSQSIAYISRLNPYEPIFKKNTTAIWCGMDDNRISLRGSQMKMLNKRRLERPTIMRDDQGKKVYRAIQSSSAILKQDVRETT